MIKGEVKLKNPEIFSDVGEFSEEKAKKALERATGRVEKLLDKFSDNLIKPALRTNTYEVTDKVSWTTGMGTALYWLAYEYTGNKKFRDAAEKQCELYMETAEKKIGLIDHDIGFKFLPSLVAQYKITGNERAKKAAIIAADEMLEHVCPVNHFIIRDGKGNDGDPLTWYRSLVDSMMNIPLFFWAHQETGDKKYLDAAVNHYRETVKYLIREDGSSYHHYQYDLKTRKPLYGLTFQGHADDSCWSRGHSWLVYGFPIAFSYTKNDEIPPIFEAVSNYFLNNLPDDFVPYWDLCFTTGSLEPRDSSAVAIVACGLLEMCKYIPSDSPKHHIYKNAAYKLVNALIDKCEQTGDNTDGIIGHVVGAKPQGLSIDTIATYGDFFYMEALMRILKPDFRMYW